MAAAIEVPERIAPCGIGRIAMPLAAAALLALGPFTGSCSMHGVYVDDNVDAGQVVVALPHA